VFTPGIIAIGGTGSIVFGVNEAGEQLRNYDVGHWGGGRASSVAYDSIHGLLAGDGVEADEGFARQIYAFWEVADLAGLRELGAVGFIEDRIERDYRFGVMAHLVTEAAEAGSPLACAVCDAGVSALCVVIRIVGSRFSGPGIEVVLVGGVVRSSYVQKAVPRSLAEDRERQYTAVEPAFAPEIGAAIMALKNHGIAIDEAVAARLSEVV
jgi:glucosamine kinase